MSSSVEEQSRDDVEPWNLRHPTTRNCVFGLFPRERDFNVSQREASTPMPPRLTSNDSHVLNFGSTEVKDGRRFDIEAQRLEQIDLLYPMFLHILNSRRQPVPFLIRSISIVEYLEQRKFGDQRQWAAQIRIDEQYFGPGDLKTAETRQTRPERDLG